MNNYVYREMIFYLFNEIGLDNTITSQRLNGFISAIEKIKEQI